MSQVVMAKKKKAETAATLEPGKALGKKGQATRDALDKAILELVDERGFTNFRLQDLCERTGLTIGAFYFHYKNKDQALEAVAAKAARELFAAIGSDIESKPLEEECRLTIRDYQRGYSNPDFQEQTRMMRSMIPANPIVTETYFAARRKIIDKLVETAVVERRQAGLRAGPERAIIEYLFSGLADFFETLYMGKDTDIKRSAGSDSKIVERLAKLWFRAIMEA
ncbi:MAG: TetR/AcrR family transcriptional regulator [Pseudomonadota bacterium]